MIRRHDHVGCVTFDRLRLAKSSLRRAVGHRSRRACDHRERRGSRKSSADGRSRGHHPYVSRGTTGSSSRRAVRPTVGGEPRLAVSLRRRAGRHGRRVRSRTGDLPGRCTPGRFGPAAPRPCERPAPAPVLADIEVVDVEIEVQLLRVFIARPVRRHVTGRLLEGDCRPAVARQLRPLVVDVADRPARDRRVELGERLVVRAVE